MKNEYTNTNTTTNTHAEVQATHIYFLGCFGIVLGLFLFGGHDGSTDGNILVRAAGNQSYERTSKYAALDFDSAGETFGTGDEEDKGWLGEPTEGAREAVPNGEPANSVWQKRDVGADINAIIAHASRVSGNDLDFIATLDKENAGSWSTDIKNYNTNGSYDMGICQMNSTYFSHMYRDPNWSNPEWQINKCLEMYRGWEARGILHKRFYAYPKRHASKENFYMAE